MTINSVGYRNLNKVIASRVIPMSQGAIIVPRRSHPQIVKATSVARYQRRSYCRERVSKKELALT